MIEEDSKKFERLVCKNSSRLATTCPRKHDDAKLHFHGQSTKDELPSSLFSRRSN